MPVSCRNKRGSSEAARLFVRRRRSDPDPGIQDDGVFGRDPDRVEIELGDGGLLVGQCTNPTQEVEQGIDRDGLRAPVAEQQR